MTPLTSTLRSIYNLIIRRLRFPDDYVGKTVKMEDGKKFKIFRHMKLNNKKDTGVESIFIVRFKFEKGTHKTNIKKSRIPILMIGGFPGFKDKLWMIDYETDYWQGVYQWKDIETIEKYRNSFVLGLMNKRSINETLSYRKIPDKNIDDYLKSKLI